MSDNADRDATIAYHARQGRSAEWIAGQVRLNVEAVKRIIRRAQAGKAPQNNGKRRS